MLVIKTLEQKRAKDALDKVKGLLQEVENNKEKVDANDKYASYVKSLPATILMNGLGQAVATMLAASSSEYKLLCGHLQGWLCRNDTSAPYPGANDLLTAITSNDRNAYLRAQVESLAWLTWLKKFAVAYLEKPEAVGKNATPL